MLRIELVNRFIFDKFSLTIVSSLKADSSLRGQPASLAKKSDNLWTIVRLVFAH